MIGNSKNVGDKGAWEIMGQKYDELCVKSLNSPGAYEAYGPRISHNSILTFYKKKKKRDWNRFENCSSDFKNVILIQENYFKAPSGSRQLITVGETAIVNCRWPQR